ncbi:unnamed protein product [Bursaphelenchus okinawaensis]|uniref:Uncharacterized protein n=1 Tax=Bursaphelenchus okinawaensis TaxID=465554 RepID=A0A811KGG8_9BILA|nr:unnamed protein product [Bursaphelenchus okinawaensis]CAG9102694.1 unnamed protein product [Bursaphelenchus okinawaensis]
MSKSPFLNLWNQTFVVSYICDTNEDLAIGQFIWDLTAYAQFSLGLLSQTSVDILTALTCVTPAEREYCA